MGQYHKIINLDKCEYLHPHTFGDGLKLMEFGSSGQGTMMALAILLAVDNGRGGGDLNSEHPLVGSWAGDRIIISGDYGTENKHIPDNQPKGFNLYCLALEYFTDISKDVLEVLKKAGEIPAGRY